MPRCRRRLCNLADSPAPARTPAVCTPGDGQDDHHRHRPPPTQPQPPPQPQPTETTTLGEKGGARGQRRGMRGGKCGCAWGARGGYARDARLRSWQAFGCVDAHRRLELAGEERGAAIVLEVVPVPAALLEQDLLGLLAAVLEVALGVGPVVVLAGGDRLEAAARAVVKLEAAQAVALDHKRVLAVVGCHKEPLEAMHGDVVQDGPVVGVVGVRAAQGGRPRQRAVRGEAVRGEAAP